MFATKKKGNAVVWILVIIVIVGLGWWAVARRGSDTATTTPATSTDTTVTPTTDDVSLEGDMIDDIIIVYGADGFSPKTSTINKGQTVKWINQSGGPMWIASADHPTHTLYSGTTLNQHCPQDDKNNFDECMTGDTYSFTFDKVGEWRYHNHSKSSDTGTIIVK